MTILDAIILGLVLAYVGGATAGGSKGLSDVTLFSGLGLMGGGMLRDLAIIATAYGVNLKEIRQTGFRGVVALFVGVLISFIAGGGVAIAFGYTDPVDITTIGQNLETFGQFTRENLNINSAICARFEVAFKR
mgnify:CR=1 FL=1